jgi:hypothetical protein
VRQNSLVTSAAAGSPSGVALTIQIDALDVAGGRVSGSVHAGTSGGR